MDEFTHDSDDDLLGLFAIGLKSIAKFFEQWVEDAGIHGGHK